MRVISQDKMKDIPYENAVFTIEERGCEYAVYGYSAYKYSCCLLAIYNSEEKAKQVFNMLHETYLNLNKDCTIFQFPANEDVDVE